MNLELTEKVVIITGASAGLGKAIAFSLAQEGAKIAISGRRKDALEKTAAEIRQRTQAHVLTFAGDMSQSDDIQAFISLVEKQWGTVHILVNNVGQATRGTHNQLSQADWQKTIEVNLFSSVQCSQHVIPYMRQQQWGRIINISALSGKEPADAQMASNTIKAALINYSKSLSREVAQDNILVNCVSPGLIESPQNERWFSNEEKTAAIDNIPLKRFGTPQEFADAVTFLCSQRASYINGINMIMDGGSSRSI
ncbi:MAG: SDR family oxidoreductase [Anaerolineaceae bacterium]|nr:SDR family oxidoreductase [Anaerolineaceae bacterium]